MSESFLDKDIQPVQYKLTHYVPLNLASTNISLSGSLSYDWNVVTTYTISSLFCHSGDSYSGAVYRPSIFSVIAHANVPSKYTLGYTGNVDLVYDIKNGIGFSVYLASDNTVISEFKFEASSGQYPSNTLSVLCRRFYSYQDVITLTVRGVMIASTYYY